MKKLFIASLCLVAFQSAYSKESLCPETSKEVAACISKKLLPMIPFVSICAMGDGSHAMAIDYGSTRGPDLYEAKFTETASQYILEAISEDMDKSTLTVEKSSSNKTEGIFSYEILGSKIVSAYKCTL
jgi:hypothetical protein